MYLVTPTFYVLSKSFNIILDYILLLYSITVPNTINSTLYSFGFDNTFSIYYSKKLIPTLDSILNIEFPYYYILGNFYITCASDLVSN